jgi:hypothetical protein
MAQASSFVAYVTHTSQVTHRVQRLLSGADLLDVVTQDEHGRDTHWLLVPVRKPDLDWLAEVGADDAEREDDEREP